MSQASPPFDWLLRDSFDWSSPVGIDQIRRTVQPAVGFEPDPYQLQCAARILMGQDVFCISATGDGKSSLIYIPALVREGTISLVISPTNFLEGDMVENLRKKQVSAIAINSETLAAAELDGHRDLWAEAKTGLYHVIFIGPETMKTHQYSMFILDATVHARLGQFTVDEAHLAVEWGVDFRTAYQDISTMRARLPMHTVFVALSASVEPGRQFESCLTTMGFRQGRYHLEKRDCERHNVALVMRTINYTSSTYEFRDLDWLIPETLTKASDVLKRIVFCQAIELGHRLVIYLRKLLPIHIRHLAHKLIRHHHSLNCPDCKSEGLTSIYKVNEDRDCAVHVSTDVLSVGVDIPDLPEVVIFGTLSSLSALVQRAGRPARERGSFGRAIIYVKKTDIAEARKYVASEDGELDVRLLHEKDPGSHLLLSDVVEGVEPEQSVEAESDISDDEDHNKEVGDVIAPAQPPTNKSQSKAKKKSSKSRQKAVTKPSSLSPPGKRTCLSLTLVIAAYVRHLCLTRQINIIFKNPGMLKDCGRCSSCIGDHNIPAPRPLQLIPAPSASLPSACETLLPDPGLTPLPGYMKLLVKDADKVAKEIAIAARSLRWKTYPRLDDTLLIGSRSFLLPNMIKKITHNFFALTAIDVLRDRMDGWRYWSQYGELLWEAVKTLVDEYRGIVIKRHEQSLEKQRRKRTLNVLLSAGLDQVKRVTLRLPASPGGEGPPSRFPMASTSAHTTAPIGSIDTIQQTPSSTLLPKDVNALVGSKRKSASDNSQQNSKRRKASKAIIRSNKENI